tara:strand:- start:1044 stop:1646 length:603 start_codon:yes stop_codon:yes gene_type:complete
MNKEIKSIENQLKLFNKLARKGNQTQRTISKELNVALGVANTMIKRFVKKGLLKLNEAPMKRYLYYVTAKGFVEKAKLVREFVHSSLNFYRKAKIEFEKIFLEIKKSKYKTIVLIGTGELTEIAILSANITESKNIIIYEKNYSEKKFCGVNIEGNIEKFKSKNDKFVFILTQPNNSMRVYKELSKYNFKIYKPKFLLLD